MQVEVGAVLTGKVTAITKYGAFVDLSEGKSGMIHISEVASSFVKEIRDYLTENQEVKGDRYRRDKSDQSFDQAVGARPRASGAPGAEQSPAHRECGISEAAAGAGDFRRDDGAF